MPDLYGAEQLPVPDPLPHHGRHLLPQHLLERRTALEACRPSGCATTSLRDRCGSMIGVVASDPAATSACTEAGGSMVAPRPRCTSPFSTCSASTSTAMAAGCRAPAPPLDEAAQPVLWPGQDQLLA
jgi:hypothetical protein